MPRYPKQPLEVKLAWMRERQRAKEEDARRKAEEELMARLMALSEEKAAWVREQMRRDAESRYALPERRRKMLRVDQVAEELGVSTRTVWRWFADRAVIVKPGLRRTTMLIPQQALDDWYAEHEPASSR